MGFTFDFSDRTIVITGGAGAIGAETAKIFAAGGAAVVLADLSLTDLERTAERLALDPDRTLLFEYEAASYDSNRRLVAAALNRFGSIDHLVPCAGIYRDVLVEDMTPEQWQQTISVNLDGSYWLIHAAWPSLSDGASIVTVASVAAYRGSALHAHYAASKGGVLGLTRSLALEGGARGLRVNAVAPGIIETPMTSGLLRRRGEELIEQTPLGRNGTPTEVASAIAFLASDAASFISGETIHVNGGLYIAP